MNIPERATGARRPITTDDVARLRDIDSLSVSPDGHRFAILVRQAVPEKNTFRTAYFVGSLQGGALTYVGDGGEARRLTKENGRTSGEYGGSVIRWSPDGRHIAYTVLRDGEVQLWSSRTDVLGQRQLTHNASDIRDFSWSGDGRSLYFRAGVTRADLAERAEKRSWSGYRMQEFDQLFRATLAEPPVTPLQANLAIWRVGADGSDERAANEAEAAELAVVEKLQFNYRGNGVETDTYRISAAFGPPIPRGDGAVAWLERLDPSQTGPLPVVRLAARLSQDGPSIVCKHAACEGQWFRKVWWSGDGRQVLLWSINGPTETAQSLFAWNPRTGAVRTITSATSQFLTECVAARSSIVCLRESPIEARHVAVFDVGSGAMIKAADVNPELAGFDLGRVESIEWDNDPQSVQLGYARRSTGFILFPPGYDPQRPYPVFVAPYRLGGAFLRGDVGDEHPLLAYAANGFIVVKTGFPNMSGLMTRSDRNRLIRELYDPKKGYPHLSAFSGSTFRGLDLAGKRASIDPARIGIGGVSHGAFVPLLMVQRQDRFAAVAVAGGSWNQLDYYFAKLPEPYGEHPETQHPEEADYWAGIDLSQHIETIEAPVLFNTADREVISNGVLIRRMVDARLAVEAYSFPNELHEKWQPAHRLAIYNRNLDWFRFWLQDIEDPAPAKAEQYIRWRQLRELQCRNPRSLRNYCAVTSASIPPAG